MKNFRGFFYENCPEEYAQLGRFGHTAWRRMEDEKILTEGLITSYPTDSVMSMLSRTYSDCVTHMQADPIISNKGSGNTSGISFYVSKEKATQDFQNELSNNLKVYGYFIAFTEPFNDEMGYFIEPKFPFKINRKYLKGKNIYHTTHKKYLKKIQKVGLVPRDTETHFHHDGNRIYLMFSDNMDVMVGLKSTIGRSKGWRPEDMVILQLSIPTDVDIYIDPNFEDNTIYTSGFVLKNIPPNNVKVID
jgi:hypothetical protein